MIHFFLNNFLGKFNGLQLELFIGKQSECKSPFSLTSGLELFIHNHTYQINEENFGIQASVGTHTSIGVERTIISRLSNPYSDCVDKENTNKFVNNFVKQYFPSLEGYTHETCMQLCYQDTLKQNYSCIDEFLPFLNKQAEKYCGKIHDSLDNEKFYNIEANKECSSLCPVDCEQVNIY